MNEKLKLIIIIILALLIGAGLHAVTTTEELTKATNYINYLETNCITIQGINNLNQQEEYAWQQTK